MLKIRKAFKLTDSATSLALSSLKPRVSNILWPADSFSDQIPRSIWVVVISPLSPAVHKTIRW
jgi:hypothetical protein